MAVRVKQVVLGLVVAGAAVCGGVWFFVLRPPADIRAYWSAQAGWDDDAGDQSAARCLEVSERFPATTGGLCALLLAARQAGDTPAGKEASTRFIDLIATADPRHLGGALDREGGGDRLRAVPQFAPPLVARVRTMPEELLCGRLLAACCSMTRPDDDGQPPAVYQEAADLIAARHAGSPDLEWFCQPLAGAAGSPPWAARYERHLRAILAVNEERKVRCTALFALASIVHAGGEERQSEAEALFAEFCDTFDGTHAYSYQFIEQNYVHEARTQLHDLRFHAVGMPATEIAGVDLDDKAMTLGEYKGRVVLLTFWGTWCFPCMKLVPHERELVAAHQGRPFAVVGVNCDDDAQKARDAVTRTQMSWRSFKNEAGERAAITKDWKVIGFPTLYVIDHHGVIRKRWVGAPPAEEMGHVVKVLVDAAKKGVAVDAMKPVVAAMAIPAPGTKAPEAAGTSGHGGRFEEKVYHESKYTVFVPAGYDGAKPVPAILYLHGSGPRGTDGQAHLRTGLAKAIRGRKQPLPFLVVFPQAREGEDWTATNAGGKRALAILADVEKEYRVDRVALTGVSMGGAGTWSLAAADPQRWSAIIPICHGGDVASAAKLVGVPCWCFHGAADKMIPPRQSREMAEAITQAGGRVQYQEFAGVGHDDCPDRVYAMDEVYEWLLEQARPRR